MSFRFWRRIKLAPGLTLNLSKTGGSLSLGPRGAKVTVGPHGNRATAGISGTGLFYTRKLSSGGARHASSRPPVVPPEDRLTLGFFQRLVIPDEEKSFVDGCRELVLGHEDQARTLLAQADHLADGAYLAGFLALKQGQLLPAVDFLQTAVARPEELGRYFDKYGISANLKLPITAEVAALVGPHERGVLLGLVEAYQQQQRFEEAIACLQRLRKLEPADVVVKLSLAELLLDARAHDKATAKQVVKLAEGINNETAMHAALLLCKSSALRELGLAEAAHETLTTALRRHKDRPPELLHAIRYERALVLGDLGRQGQARKDFERLYAEDPGYRDVAARLGL